MKRRSKRYKELAKSAVTKKIDSKEIFDTYIDNLKPIFKIIAECENADKDIDTLLEGPVCQSGFKRLN